MADPKAPPKWEETLAKLNEHGFTQYEVEREGYAHERTQRKMYQFRIVAVRGERRVASEWTKDYNWVHGRLQWLLDLYEGGFVVPK